MAASTLSLRPLGTGELIDRAVRLYRRHFLTFIGIVAIVQIPLTLAQAGFSILTIQGAAGPGDAAQAAVIAGSVGSAILTILGFVLVSSLGTAALTLAIANSYLGQPVSLASSYRQIGRSWLVLALALLLILLLSFLFTLWWLVPCIGWFTGLGMLLFVSLVISPLAAPVVVLEQQRAKAAVRRAWDLSRRRFWPVVGFVSVLFVLSMIFTVTPNLLVGFLMNLGIVPLPGDFVTQQIVSTAISSLTTLLFSLIFLPFQLTAMTLLYFDLRIRTEGFDLALLAHSMGQPDEQEQQPAAELEVSSEAAVAAYVSETMIEAPPPEREDLITGRELGYFMILTLTLGAVYFLLVFGVGFLAMATTGGM